VAVCAQCKSIVEEAARFCPHCGVPIVKAPARIGAGTELELEDWGKAVVGQVIGEGGMGIVYRAWIYYNPTGRFANTPSHPAAVKVLHPLLRGRDKARRLFQREAETLQRLSHPNIVHFLGLLEYDSQLALIMELVQGESLLDLLSRVTTQRPFRPMPALPFAHAWHYFSQLLGALAAIHELGIVHRDIKSANVLIRPDGVVKVSDFGIARVPAEEVRNTGGMAPGTGAYMAPEQVLGKDLDARADLYAAAIVLYEMLTGTTPFDAPDRSELAIRAAQVDEAPPPLAKFLPQTPAVLEMLLARALAKDPALRYGSAIEMGEAFRTALGLPESRGWQAQQKLAEVARTLSLAMPALTPPELEARAAEYRTDVMAEFRR
jgi:serine/threonine-protein kinase